MPGRCHRFSVDDVDLVQIFDGAIHRERGHEYFGTNVDERTFNAECRALGTSPGAFDFSVTATLIEAQGQRVLVDAGFGSSGPERSGGLPMGLEELGVDPQSIDLVVITHLHLDHTGGLLKEDGSPRFSAARHLIAAEEARAEPNDPVLAALGPLLEHVSPGLEVLPGVRLVDLHGHTPGHIGLLVERASTCVLIASDLANHPVWAFAHPQWHMLYDADGDKASAVRSHWLGRVADEGLIYIGYHMPFPALGRVERVGAAFRYVPLDPDSSGSSSAA